MDASVREAEPLRRNPLQESDLTSMKGAREGRTVVALSKAATPVAGADVGKYMVGKIRGEASGSPVNLQ